MAMRRATIGAIVAIIIAGVAIGTTAMSALVFNRTLSGTGSISIVGALGAYSDSNCQTPLTSVNWGAVLPGGMATQTAYIKNLGNINATLTLTATNWNSTAAQSYLTLGWNLTSNYLLQAGKVVHTALTLAASSSATTNMSFSFNIVITGTQH
jgi:hypothetical protein